MNFKKLGTALFAGLLLASPLATVSAQDTVKVGGNFELSGAAAAYGTPMANGLKLAVKQYNQENGGVNGKKVEAQVEDNKSDKTEAAAAATKLVAAGVAGIVGPATTGDALAEIPVANDGKTPAIFPAATGNGITLDSAGKVYDYIYRVCFEDSFQGVAAANYLADTQGYKKVVLLVDQANDYSQGLADSFVKQFEAKGGTIVAKESYQTNDTDFLTVLTNISTQDFDALYVPGYYTEAGLIIKQARELGIDKPIVGGDGFANDTLVELAGKDNLNNVFYTSHYSDKSDDPAVKKFVEAYEKEYGKKPDTFAALAYDATNVLLQAIKDAGSTDPQEVNEALAKIKDFKGVTGTFSFDEKHNPVKTAVMLHFEKGEVTEAVNVSAE